MGMIDHVFDTSTQLRWGVDIQVPSLPPSDRLILAGMGGSGMAARIGALIAGEAGGDVHVHQGYGLPRWAAAAKPPVVAVSYSGNTEETRSVVGEAMELGLPVVVISAGGALAETGLPAVTVPGGLLPRAALGYQAAAVLRVLHASGSVPDVRPALEEAAAVVDELLADGEGAGAALGHDLADALDGKVTVIYGGEGPPAVAAYRWKTQINENAKAPAYVGILPELNHNEIEGWSGPDGLVRRRVAVVVLRDPEDHPRIATRAALTQEVIADMVPLAGEVFAQGSHPLARVFGLVAVGDVASVRMAELAGVEPEPIPVLEGFKQRLKEV